MGFLLYDSPLECLVLRINVSSTRAPGRLYRLFACKDFGSRRTRGFGKGCPVWLNLHIVRTAAHIRRKDLIVDKLHLQFERERIARRAALACHKFDRYFGVQSIGSEQRSNLRGGFSAKLGRAPVADNIKVIASSQISNCG